MFFKLIRGPEIKSKLSLAPRTACSPFCTIPSDRELACAWDGVSSVGLKELSFSLFLSSHTIDGRRLKGSISHCRAIDAIQDFQDKIRINRGQSSHTGKEERGKKIKTK